MGRSISYPSVAIVALAILVADKDDDREVCDLDFVFEWLREDLCERAHAAFPSLIPHQVWRGRKDRVLMRNAYADFGVSIYGELVTVWLVERKDDAYRDADWRRAWALRAARWLRQIAPRLDALFGRTSA